MIAYHLPEIGPAMAAEASRFAPWRYAGPWSYTAHPHGGTLAVWKDWPEVGRTQTHALEAFGAAVEVAPGVRYLPPAAPLTPERIYDLVLEGPAGIDVRLACGLTITVPPALITHRRRALSARGAADVRYVSEYGALAHALLLTARETDERGEPRGIAEDDPRLPRLLALAIGQRYRSTPELLDDLGLIAEEDTDPLLAAIWGLDPKAVRPAGAPGGPSPSASSGSSATS